MKSSDRCHRVAATRCYQARKSDARRYVYRSSIHVADGVSPRRNDSLCEGRESVSRAFDKRTVSCRQVKSGVSGTYGATVTFMKRLSQ